MINKTYLRTFFHLFIFIVLLSCNNKKAIDFKNTIVQKDSILTKTIFGEKGAESRRLNYVIQRDYNNALIAIDEEEIVFNSIIKEIEMLNTNDIIMGKELKNTAVMRYSTMKKKYVYYSRKEVEQSKLAHTLYEKDKNAGEKLRTAEDQLVNIVSESLNFSKEVYKTDSIYRATLTKFNRENGL